MVGKIIECPHALKSFFLAIIYDSHTTRNTFEVELIVSRYRDD